MRKVTFTLSLICLLVFFGSGSLAQTIMVTSGTLNIGPVLVGNSSADGAHSFGVSGTLDPFQTVYVDAQNAQFTVSLTGLAGSYSPTLSYTATGTGDIAKTIYVKYTPDAAGVVNSTILVYDFVYFNFVNKSVLGVGQAPEIKMEGRESGADPWDEIVDGETTPSTSEGTDFGTALASTETEDRTFQISNISSGGFSGNLNLTEYVAGKYVELLGANADQFSVTVEPTSPVAANGGTTTFTIQFAPTTAGLKTATVSIGNNDSNENPFTFAIQGTGGLIPPGSPTADPATQIDNNSFFANWTVGGGGITSGYFLDVATNAGFTSFVPGYNMLDVGSVTSYEVTGLNPNTMYYFRVTPYNDGGSGTVSGSESLTTAPAVPNILPATNVENDGFYANWTFTDGATGYRLDVNTASNFTGTAIYNDEPVVNNFKFVSGVEGGTTYYYRVRSNNGNSSENSGTISVVTVTNPPVATAATDIDATQFTANWNDPSGGAPDFYRLDVSETNTFSTFVTGYQNKLVSGNSHVVSGLMENTQYFYRLRGLNVSGVSSNSNTISLYTYTSSTTATWTGAVSTAWNHPGNWNTGIPGPLTDATIATAANQPVVSRNSVCNDLTVNPGATLDVMDAYSLIASGNVLLKATSAANASLIESGGLVVSGTSGAEDYLEENRWHYVSTPVSGAIADVFYDIFLRYWDESTQDWTYIEDEFEPLVVGEGYSAWTSPTYLGNTTVTYTGGSFNQGSYDLPVQYSGGPGWDIVGNPYPSGIDWDDPSWIKTNIDGSIYIWDGVQYKVWNGTVGDITDGVIPAFQSFYVKTDASPALQVNNDARTHGPAPYKASEVQQLLEMHISGNGYGDHSYIHFNAEASTGFDNAYDAYKLEGIDEGPQLFSTVEEKKLAINVLPEFFEELTIPVGMYVGADGEYTFHIEGSESFEMPIAIFLEDLKTSGMIDVSNGNPYVFEASLEDDAERFVLHFQMLTTDVASIPANEQFSIYSNDQTVFVKRLDGKAVNGTISIFNISGMEVYNEKHAGSSVERIDLSSETGYYIVRLLTPDAIVSEKVFIK